MNYVIAFNRIDYLTKKLNFESSSLHRIEPTSKLYLTRKYSQFFYVPIQFAII